MCVLLPPPQCADNCCLPPPPFPRQAGHDRAELLLRPWVCDLAGLARLPPGELPPRQMLAGALLSQVSTEGLWERRSLFAQLPRVACRLAAGPLGCPAELPLPLPAASASACRRSPAGTGTRRWKRPACMGTWRRPACCSQMAPPWAGPTLPPLARWPRLARQASLPGLGAPAAWQLGQMAVPPTSISLCPPPSKSSTLCEAAQTCTYYGRRLPRAG